MKIGTQNRLAHLQVEYQELNEQTMMLQNQVAPLNASIQQYQNYLSYNQGDRVSLKKYREALNRHNSLLNQIRRNQNRLANLSMQITREMQRVAVADQRQMCSMQNKAMRAGYNQMMVNNGYRPY